MPNQTKLRAFLIYNKRGVLIGGPILRTKAPKEHRTFVEIPVNKCCDLPALTPMYETLGRLMAFVKYNNAGKVIPFSVIKRRYKPKDANEDWVQIALDLCCTFNTTTTTTSTSTSSTTTTTTTAATTTTSSTTTTTTTV